MANGPLSILQTAVRSHAQVLISIRSNRKLCVASPPLLLRYGMSTGQSLTCFRPGSRA